ncbi:acyl-CoA reductase [Aurantibacillus circumpalustris]|uniref:acyl-CoA reductase n=1 Tax=Aurantibacillus circumpalustris TaxID=3036359 RepID=UPI00295B054B|nr:acyl-CoA reductase [Aurantibacillus circumpalustris]
MTLKQRIKGFVEVGLFINRHFSSNRISHEEQLHQGLDKVIEVAHVYNNWFIPKFVNDAITNIGLFLTEKDLIGFSAPIKENKAKTVAIICAGNIPLVCFHDVLCVLLSGNNALIKPSSDDHVLLPFFLKLLVHYEPEFEKQILFAEGKLTNFDAVIATGSDNTASHLHYYFAKYPNIIRKSRSSVAILTGNEKTEDLNNLGIDIFQYFGLGCRNVSKLLVPQGYKFDTLFESLIDYGFVVNNKKYGNNYDYHRAIYLLESMAFLDNNFVMIKESNDLHSPVGVLYYQYYNGNDAIQNYLQANTNNLQCVVGENYVPFGYSQRPVITDFADNVNTLEFLVNL